MKARRQCTKDFEANVALGTSQRDKTVQIIAGRHKAQPDRKKRSRVGPRITILSGVGSHLLARKSLDGNASDHELPFHFLTSLFW
jgi:hypothetical protein